MKRNKKSPHQNHLNLIMIILLLTITFTSCQNMMRNEIINDLKITEDILPQKINANTTCNQIYYEESSNAITIEYITHGDASYLYDSPYNNEDTQKSIYLHILNNNPENNSSQLLKRCARAKLNIKIINKDFYGNILINKTYTPEDYLIE